MDMNASASLVLPIIAIQHDFQTVLSDVADGVGASTGEDFWVSCYRRSEPSVHGKVGVSLTAMNTSAGGRREVGMRARDGVVFERGDRGQYTASCAALSIPPTRVRVPRHIVRDPEDSDRTIPKQITALAVAPDLSQLAIGHADGTIRRFPLALTTSPPSSLPAAAAAAAPALPLTYAPHLSGTAITALRYFPSSRVLLSAGADFALHVLDADPTLSSSSSSALTKSARALRGHRRSVTDMAIVGRGRTVLSCARDGTARVWDVAAGAQICVLAAARGAPVNAMSLGPRPAGWTPPRLPGDADADADAARDEPAQAQVDTDSDVHGKLLFLALQDGHVEAFDLGSNAPVFHSARHGHAPAGALTAISYSADTHLLATGSARGIVALWDTRRLGGAPLCSFERTEAGVEGLAFLPNPGPGAPDGDSASLAVATADGLPYVAGLSPDGPEVRAELAGGGDCEAVRVVRVDEAGGVWLAGDDGVVRMY